MDFQPNRVRSGLGNGRIENPSCNFKADRPPRGMIHAVSPPHRRTRSQRRGMAARMERGRVPARRPGRPPGDPGRRWKGTPACRAVRPVCRGQDFLLDTGRRAGLQIEPRRSSRVEGVRRRRPAHRRGIPHAVKGRCGTGDSRRCAGVLRRRRALRSVLLGGLVGSRPSTGALGTLVRGADSPRATGAAGDHDRRPRGVLVRAAAVAEDSED